MMDETNMEIDGDTKSEGYEHEIDICELEREECLRMRSLWEEVFYEDSKEFTDYYFTEKAARNHAFALQGPEGMRAMLYLAPYPMQLRVGTGWECREINYIIGVATRKEYRHRGYMDRLLRRALRYMYGKRQPFAFLMPASPKIYQPYQFAYIYDRQEYKVQNTEYQPTEFMDEEEIPALKRFASAFLSKNYDVFIRRDEAYYQVLMKELKAQDGGICLSRNMDEVNGYLLYTREEKGEIQEAVWTEETCDKSSLHVNRTEGDGSCSMMGLRIEKADKKPIIMSRIIDVKEMLLLLRTGGEEVEMVLQIEDPILEQNSGNWKCMWNAEQACVQKISELFGENEGHAERVTNLRVTIEHLTSWVFGYKKAEECFDITADMEGAEGKKLFDRLAAVKTLRRVFINEIV